MVNLRGDKLLCRVYYPRLQSSLCVSERLQDVGFKVQGFRLRK
jgi:hypothetical protein